MELTKNPLVCFFDSGIGGLSLLYECVKRLPQVDFTYFSDNSRVPYGNLTHEELIKFTDEAFEKINSMQPCAVVAACNTVTAECIDFLRKKYTFPIIGIQPAVKPASKIGGKCLVLVTLATAKSESFNNLIKNYASDAEVVPCKDLAGYIEQNIFNLSEEGVEKLLPKVKPQSVVLGCTHYAFIKHIITNYYNCPVFDGLDGTAERLKSVLGISAAEMTRKQNLSFIGGAEEKNRRVFDFMLIKNGFDSEITKKS